MYITPLKKLFAVLLPLLAAYLLLR